MAHILAAYSPAEWKGRFSDLEDMLIFTPGDLKSAPPSEFHLVTGPGAQCEGGPGPLRV